MKKVPCKNCDKMILQTTAKKTYGYCMPCKKEKDESKILASRYEIKPKVSIEDINIFFKNDNNWELSNGLGDFLFQFYEHIKNPEGFPKLYNIIDLVCEFEAGYRSSGLWLYLNNYGANAEVLKDALKIIGASELLEIMDMVSSFFPDKVIPGDDNIRRNILESENIEKKINALGLKYKKYENRLLLKLVDYLSPRKQEILDEVNSYGKIIKYDYDPDE